MENNKLQELTRKLYDEGLSQGRADADKLVAEAEIEAKKIVVEAEAKAAKIVADANKTSEELQKNTTTELSLASKQAVATLKESIANMITARTISTSVHSVNLDATFVKEMLLAVAKSWKGDDSEKITLSALLPEEHKAKFEKEFSSSASALLAEGIDVGYSSKVKSGFKIGAKDGGYYISFSDSDFDALFSEFSSERLSEILYK